MGRALRADAGGYAYHVLNRANARLRLFHKPADYAAFEAILAEAQERFGTRLLSYCVMPNHWHMVVWPKADGELSRFVGWITLTHTQRWHAHHRNVGTGHLYQGRFKSFPIEKDDHLLSVLRYVERNPLRASLVAAADAWRWSSLWRRLHGEPEDRQILSDWPVPCPSDWLSQVAAPHTEAELEALRRSAQRGQPYGSEAWVKRTTTRFGLEATLRPRGRPRKQTGDAEKSGEKGS